MHSNLTRNSNSSSNTPVSLSGSSTLRLVPELILFNLPIVKVNERLTMTSLTDLYMNHVVVGPSIYTYLPLQVSLYLSLSFAPFLHGIHGLLARIRSLLTEQQFLCFSCYYYSLGTYRVDKGGRWMAVGWGQWSFTFSACDLIELKLM